MPHRYSQLGLFFAALAGLLLVGACGGPSTIPRGSTSGPPTIDGALSEWGGSLSYLEGEPVSMSVLPTDSLLYVALATQDQPLIRSVAQNGLVVWVDPAGGKRRAYGVQYPLGLRAQRAGRRAAGAAGTSESSQAAFSFDQLSLRELAIHRADSTRVRIPAQFSSGVRAQATIDSGALVYELAIPVGSGTEGGTGARHGLRTPLSNTVGIGLQTPEGDDDDVSMPARNMPSVTGRQGRTRRQGRRGQRQRARQSQDTSLPTLDLWTRVSTTAP